MCIKIFLSEREDSAQYSSLGVEKTNPKSCWVSMSQTGAQTGTPLSICHLASTYPASELSPLLHSHTAAAVKQGLCLHNSEPALSQQRLRNMKNSQLDVEANTWNPSTRLGHEFKASLSYTVEPCLIKTKMDEWPGGRNRKNDSTCYFVSILAP